MNKFFIWEDKVKNWIETHRFIWCCMLLGIGFSLGFLSIGNPKVGLIYGSALVIIELSAGGSGSSELN